MIWNIVWAPLTNRFMQGLAISAVDRAIQRVEQALIDEMNKTVPVGAPLEILSASTGKYGGTFTTIEGSVILASRMLEALVNPEERGRDAMDLAEFVCLRTKTVAETRKSFAGLTMQAIYEQTDLSPLMVKAAAYAGYWDTICSNAVAARFAATLYWAYSTVIDPLGSESYENTSETTFSDYNNFKSKKVKFRLTWNEYWAGVKNITVEEVAKSFENNPAMVNLGKFLAFISSERSKVYENAPWDIVRISRKRIADLQANYADEVMLLRSLNQPDFQSYDKLMRIVDMFDSVQFRSVFLASIAGEITGAAPDTSVNILNKVLNAVQQSTGLLAPGERIRLVNGLAGIAESIRRDLI